MELKDTENPEPFKVFGSNAGWFSDNNFLAEAGQTYTIDYESFSSSISVAEFQTRLTSRVLQSIYSETDFAAMQLEVVSYLAWTFCRSELAYNYKLLD